MKGATDYEDEGDLKEPVNQVLAILSADVDRSSVVKALHERPVLLKTPSDYYRVGATPKNWRLHPANKEYLPNWPGSGPSLETLRLIRCENTTLHLRTTKLSLR
jgi:hypothetical protein